MKKLILVLVFVICMLFVAGCNDSGTAVNPDVDPFGKSFKVMEIHDEYPYDTYIIYHKETKVMYMAVFMKDGYGGGFSISPLYNADGTLMIYEDSKS